MLSSSDRRAAIAGLSVIATTIVIAHGLPRWKPWADARHKAAMHATRDLELLRRSVDKRNETTRQLAALRSAVREQREWLVTAGAPALNYVVLVRTLSDIAGNSGVELTSVLPLASKTASSGRFTRRVRARAAFSGSFPKVVHFLSALEGGSPRFVLRQIALSQAASAQASRDGQIRGDLIVEGLVSTDSTATVRP